MGQAGQSNQRAVYTRAGTSCGHSIMSTVYFIKDTTSGITWYEASMDLLHRLHHLVAPERVSFFSDYELEPDENHPTHLLPGAEVARQVIIILNALRDTGDGAGAGDPAAPAWMVGFFTDLLTACRDHPDHLWTCYAFS